MKLSERNLSLWRLYQIWFFLFDFYLFYQIYQFSHPSESWSNTSKTCLIFLLARIRVAIMERNSFNSIVPFLSWRYYSSDHKRPTHFLMLFGWFRFGFDIIMLFIKAKPQNNPRGFAVVYLLKHTRSMFSVFLGRIIEFVPKLKISSITLEIESITLTTSIHHAN